MVVMTIMALRGRMLVEVGLVMMKDEVMTGKEWAETRTSARR